MFHLIIDEKFRRKGLAKKLIAEIEATVYLARKNYHPKCFKKTLKR